MSRAEIAAWVEEHRDELPANLAELSQYPMPFRKVIVNALAPEQRIELWRAHLLTHLEPTSDLSPTQQQLVRDAIEELPALFGGTLEAGQARALALEGRVREHFTPQEALRVFGTLGPPEPSGGLPLPPDAYQPEA